MKNKTSDKCPVCNSENVVVFKEYIFCKECKEKYKKLDFNSGGPDQYVCPECGSLKTVDLQTHLYCRECEVQYDKKDFFPYYRKGYYYCPRCGNKEVMEEERRIYCEKCQLFFSKSTIRTMEDGQEQDVWSEREAMRIMGALDPEKKGHDPFKDEIDKTNNNNNNNNN